MAKVRRGVNFLAEEVERLVVEVVAREELIKNNSTKLKHHPPCFISQAYICTWAELQQKIKQSSEYRVTDMVVLFAPKDTRVRTNYDNGMRRQTERDKTNVKTELKQ